MIYQNYKDQELTPFIVKFAITKQEKQLGCANYDVGFVLQWEQTVLVSEQSGFIPSGQDSVPLSRAERLVADVFLFFLTPNRFSNVSSLLAVNEVRGIHQHRILIARL